MFNTELIGSIEHGELFVYICRECLVFSVHFSTIHETYSIYCVQCLFIHFLG